VRSLAELFGSKTPVNDAQLAVAQGVEGLAATRTWVCSVLPEELCAHVLSALERNGELTVFTESGAWAGRLTLALAEQRAQLAPRLQPEARIAVKVVPGGRYRR
jgi:hypothetical protein